MMPFAVMVSMLMPAWPGNSYYSCISSVVGELPSLLNFHNLFFAVESQKATAELFANLVAVLDKGVRDSKILIGQLGFLCFTREMGL